MALTTLTRRRARALVGKLGVGWFGLVLLAGMFSAMGLAPGLATVVLLLAAPVLLVAYMVAPALYATAVDRAPMSLARFSEAQAAEQSGLQWPLAAASLLAPITLHAWIWLLFGVALGSGKLADFDLWMGLSLPLTLAAHATLLVRGTSYVERLVGTRFGGRPPDRAEAARTLGAVALAGLVPGVVLLGIPPLVIGATGLLLIPALFGALRTTYDTERAALLQAALSEDLEHPGGLERQVHACLQTKSASDEEQMHALGLLAAIAPHDRLRNALLRYLEDATPPPGRIGNRKSLEAALALCAEHVVPPSTQACLQLARHEDPGVVRRAASFLADRPGARTQEVLQHLLRSPSIDVQLVAARALGFMGTHAAVGELGSLVSRTVNPRVRRTARTAIAAIRGRVGGAEAAALSFPAEVPRGGELSPAPGEAGELSVSTAREVAAARVAEGSAAAADEQQPDEQQAGPGPADGSTVRAGASAALVAGP